MGKIFCVGFMRTGTTSLTSAMSILGYKIIHDKRIRSVVVENLDSGRLLKGLENYDFYGDFLSMYFKRLDKDYPDSLFICTYRNPYDIAYSSLSFHQFGKEITGTVWGYSAVITRATEHYDKVFDYFSERRDRFLMIRICDGEGWEKLCPFLKKKIPNENFPTENFTKQKPKEEKPRKIQFL